MKSTAVATAPDPGAQALIREARQHQRRRYAATGVAVAAVLVAALGAFVGLHGFGGSRRPGPPRPGTRGPASRRPARTRPHPASVDTTVLYHVQWDDEIFPRDGQFEVFNALASADKRLIARSGPHAETHPDDEASWQEFLKH